MGKQGRKTKATLGSWDTLTMPKHMAVWALKIWSCSIFLCLLSRRGDCSRNLIH